MRLARRLTSAGRALARRAAPVGHALAAGAARLAYRRGELGLLALLAASLAGGLLVERWRARSPETLAWLETEPPRLRAAGARAAAPRVAPRPP
jgi:hypothetical protein